MSYIRESRIDAFSTDELLAIVKKNLDALQIPYEEKPGGFGDALVLRPEDTDTEVLEQQTVYQIVFDAFAEMEYQPLVQVQYQRPQQQICGLGDYSIPCCVA